MQWFKLQSFYLQYFLLQYQSKIITGGLVLQRHNLVKREQMPLPEINASSFPLPLSLFLLSSISSPLNTCISDTVGQHMCDSHFGPLSTGNWGAHSPNIGQAYLLRSSLQHLSASLLQMTKALRGTLLSFVSKCHDFLKLTVHGYIFTWDCLVPVLGDLVLSDGGSSSGGGSATFPKEGIAGPGSEVPSAFST